MVDAILKVENLKIPEDLKWYYRDITTYFFYL